jgi:SHAQKYF class myb-like DNA-binding protein
MGSEKHERLPSETPVGVARPSTGLSGAHLGLTLGTLKTGTPTTSTSAKGAAAQASETREGSSDQEQAGALPGNGETLIVDAAAEVVYEQPTDRLQVRTGTELPAKSPPKGQKQRRPYFLRKQRESWSPEEHQRFLQALAQYGRLWTQVQRVVKTKTAEQIRSHAQKYFIQLEKKRMKEKSSTNSSDSKPSEALREPAASGGAPRHAENAALQPGAVGTRMPHEASQQQTVFQSTEMRHLGRLQPLPLAVRENTCTEHEHNVARVPRGENRLPHGIVGSPSASTHHYRWGRTVSGTSQVVAACGYHPKDMTARIREGAAVAPHTDIPLNLPAMRAADRLEANQHAVHERCIGNSLLVGTSAGGSHVRRDAYATLGFCDPSIAQAQRAQFTSMPVLSSTAQTHLSDSHSGVTWCQRASTDTDYRTGASLPRPIEPWGGTRPLSPLSLSVTRSSSDWCPSSCASSVPSIASPTQDSPAVSHDRLRQALDSLVNGRKSIERLGTGPILKHFDQHLLQYGVFQTISQTTPSPSLPVSATEAAIPHSPPSARNPVTAGAKVQLPSVSSLISNRFAVSHSTSQKESMPYS